PCKRGASPPSVRHHIYEQDHLAKALQAAICWISEPNLLFFYYVRRFPQLVGGLFNIVDIKKGQV
ncbi:hypothetical protein KA005_28095, partial [bacterium]|nr:hypothetical protein [bacterium]